MATKTQLEFVDDPTYSSDDAPSQVSAYHPQSVRALIQLKEGLQRLLDQTNAAINLAPPPYVAPADTSPKNATVTRELANVYDTPHFNAKIVGTIAQGAALTLVQDGSRDEAYTWYKIVGGQYNGHFVKGNDLNMQTK
jgi:hypothetical protein